MNRASKLSIVFAALGSLIAAALWIWLREKYTYADPWVFWFLLLIPLLGFYEIANARKRHPQIKLSAFNQFSYNLAAQIPMHLPIVLRSAGLALLIIALARPQSELSWKNVSTEGIDIVISMDISASMLAKDFEPNRLTKAKEVAIDFIRERPNDRIGLVVYEGESFTQCPLTTDHKVLISLFKDVNTGMVEGGTAIGMGLANAVNRLRESEAKSKVVILLTDGDNNAGSIAPVTAAEIAAEYGVRVYTIGVGSRGKALTPYAIYPDGRYRYEYQEVKIDEESLKKIASITGGAYFRATDGDALEEIYTEIDRLEKTKINVTEHSRRAEEYLLYALFGVAILLAEYFYRTLILGTTP